MLEMAEPITEQLMQLETEGIVDYDCLLHCELLVVAQLLCVISDKPRASEIVNYLKEGPNKYCRICDVCNNTLAVMCMHIIIHNSQRRVLHLLDWGGCIEVGPASGRLWR